jgi:hypothetical protein
MRKNVKKKILISIFSFIVIIGIIIGLYYKQHPTYYKYNDNWIIGRTVSEIEERYGSFDDSIDSGLTIYKAYCIKEGNDINRRYYWIVVDKKTEKATKVYTAGIKGG